ncbi:hypothetical protein ACEWY4_019737 [Coilia grayii]|uniref:Ig-like domain-containing protein n=1 Tax=Coilia grayii TaxID=363190 RepID=A0ABD1JBS2_9TELE
MHCVCKSTRKAGRCLCLCQDVVTPNGPLNKAVGEDVEFTLIDPPPAPPFQINWLFGSVLICSGSAGSVIGVNPSYEGRASLDPNTATLELRSLTLNDTGEYTLRVTMIIGQVEKEWKTTLRVFERVSDAAITIAGSPDPLIAGKSSVSLTCEAKGSITTRKWMQNGETLSPETDRITFSDDNRTVSISPVQKEDRGEYKCQYKSATPSVLQKGLEH